MILLVLTIVVYGQLVTHDFLATWDDPNYVTRNFAIRGFTLENLHKAFSTYYVGNYAPVQIISYMFDYSLWGLKPAGYFCSNILYHFGSGMLLFTLFLRMGLPLFGSLLGTAVFLIHPAQVESVAWISQRKNLLAMLFCLAAFHAWLYYRRAPEKSKIAWYVVSLFCFMLALMAKSVAVVFPLMLLWYDHFIHGIKGNPLSAHRDKIPFLLGAIAVGILAIVTQDPVNQGGRVSYPDNPFVVMPLTIVTILVRYLQIVFWPDPNHLSILYFPPQKEAVDSDVLVGFVAVALLVWIGRKLYLKDRKLFFWYSLFFIGLLPVSQIIPIVTLMNDRYLYFPMIGLAGLVSSGYQWFIGLEYPKILGRVLSILIIVFVVALSWASAVRTSVWKDTITLFRDATQKAPEERDPWSRLAEGYVATGDMKSARMYYEKSSKYGTLDDVAAFNLARIYLATRNLEMAAPLIRSLGKKKYENIVLLEGEYKYRMGAYPEAEELLLKYLTDFPEDVHGLYILGQVYLMTGFTQQARGLYIKALAQGSVNPGIFFALACAEFRLGDVSGSLENLDKAFVNGMTADGFREGESCLSGMNRNPRYQQILQEHLGVR